MIELRRGDAIMTVRPGKGGVVTRLAVGDVELLRPTPEPGGVLRDPRDAALYPCVPWFGRIHGSLFYGGAAYTLRPTLPDCDAENAIHGHGWVSSWDVADRGGDHLTLRLDYTPQAGGFPFAFITVQNFQLLGAGAIISLTLTNTDAQPIPAGIGLHPFFFRSSQSRLQFAAESLWTPPSAMQISNLDSIPEHLNFAAPMHPPQMEIDHSFTGFDGRVCIENGTRRILIECKAPFLHLFAPHGEDYFCLEPITHLPGAFADKTPHGGAELAPGETLSLTMKINLER